MTKSKRELNGRRSHQRKARLPSIHSFPKGMFATGSEQGTLIAKCMSGPFSKANKCGGRVGIKLMRRRVVSSNSPGERFVLFPGACYCQEQDAADDKKPMAGSQRVPWGPGKCLGDFSSLHQLAHTCRKNIPQYFFLTHLENQDGSSIFNRLFAVLMGTCSRQGRARPSAHSVTPKVTQTCEGSIHLSIQKHTGFLEPK